MTLLRSVAVAVGLSAASLTFVPRVAYAALDPKTAEADAREILIANNYTFCTKPEDPLSRRALELCPLAGEVPGCSALVEACTKTPDPPWHPWAFLEDFLRFLGRAAPYFAWGALGALVLTVFYLVTRAIQNARDEVLPVDARVAADVSTVPDAAVPEDTTAAEVLLRLAAEASARGDQRAALQTYLAAALRALDDRGAIRVARDRTNGEYVRGCKETASRPGLRDLVREVDSVQFGGNDATVEAVLLSKGRAEHIVRAPRAEASRLGGVGTLTMLMASAVLLLGACTGLSTDGRNNPAGRDLLTDLLVKQGATITSLPGSLKSLPMKGAAGPVVILDAERVPLEEETRDHLVAWVKQGGTLVLAGDPSRWPSDFWVKPLTACEGETNSGPTTLRIETRDAISATRQRQHDEDDDEDDDERPPHAAAKPSPPEVHHAKIARRAAMTWPNEDRSPRAIARTADGELYGALRAFGAGRVLGLASSELLSNVGVAVPGNAAAIIAMLATLDRHEFAIARREQGIAPPENPLSGMLHIGLGPALIHAALFLPLLFFAYGTRQSAPRIEPAPRRRAFAEHVQAVGGLYARRRAASHALAVYAKHVDDRLRTRMARGADPIAFLAARAGADLAETTELYTRAMGPQSDDPSQAAIAPRGDELRVLQKLSTLYNKAMERS
jgi:hypothetical protein